MSDNQSARSSFASRGVTMNGLKDQLYSLNMRMLLAMRSHDEQMQEELRRCIGEVQQEIDHMNMGRRFRR